MTNSIACIREDHNQAGMGVWYCPCPRCREAVEEFSEDAWPNLDAKAPPLVIDGDSRWWS